MGDIWPDLEKDIEELKLSIHNRDKVENDIRFNLDDELGSAGKTNTVGLTSLRNPLCVR